MGKRSELSAAKRPEVVLALIKREEAAAQLARRYGISEQTLYRWRDDFLAAGEAALSPIRTERGDPQRRKVEELERDLAQRDQVIGELTIANRLFKKLSDGTR